MDWSAMLDGMKNYFTPAQYTPDNQAKVDSLSSNGQPTKEALAGVEKGSIFGMTPSTFASMAGQFAGAISPKDSWQAKLGGIAAQFGSQKLAQLAQAEKEKRMTELLKQLFGQSTNKQITGVAGPDGLAVGGTATGIKKEGI